MVVDVGDIVFEERREGTHDIAKPHAFIHVHPRVNLLLAHELGLLGAVGLILRHALLEVSEEHLVELYDARDVGDKRRRLVIIQQLIAPQWLDVELLHHQQAAHI